MNGDLFTSGYLVIECLTPGDAELDTLLAEAKKARSNCAQLVANIKAATSSGL